MSQQMEIVPNMGRDGLEEPPSVDFLYHDPKTDSLPVEIIVWDIDFQEIQPPDRHWAICWTVGQNEADSHLMVRRMLQIVRENRQDGSGPLDYLTNWGPVTRTDDDEIVNAACYRIAILSYDQRKQLERIAASQPVVKPNSWWNCQHWVRNVLMQSANAGIISETDVSSVINEAGWSHGEI